MDIKYIKSLVAAAAIFTATGSALAQQTESVPADANFVSSKTRAEVVAELNQAYIDGTLVQRDGAESMLANHTPRKGALYSEARQANQDQFAGNLYLD